MAKVRVGAGRGAVSLKFLVPRLPRHQRLQPQTDLDIGGDHGPLQQCAQTYTETTAGQLDLG